MMVMMMIDGIAMLPDSENSEASTGDKSFRLSITVGIALKIK